MFIIENIFIGAILIANIILSNKIINYYSLKTEFEWNKILIKISLIISFMTFILLIYDIFLTINNVSFFSFVILWRILYWVNFALSYFILPGLRDYHNNFYFKKSKRVMFSFCKNFGINVLKLIGVIILYIYFQYTNYKGNYFDTIIAVTQAFGTFLIIASLGYSLISVPQLFLNWADKDKLKLKYLKEKEKYINKRLKMIKQSEYLYKLIKRLNMKNDLSERNINLISKVKSEYENNPYGFNTSNNFEVMNISMEEDINNLNITDSYLENKRNKIWKTFFKIRKYCYLEQKVALKLLKLRDISFKKIIFYKILFTFFTLISIIIFFLEITLPLNKNISNLPIYNFGNSLFVLLILLIPFICLIGYVIFSNLKIHIPDFAEFHGPHLTETGSLFFYVRNISRVATPLCFNILQILNIKNTHYSKLMGDYFLVPIFGKTFLTYYPMVLALIIALRILKIYKIVLKFLKISKKDKEKEILKLQKNHNEDFYIEESETDIN